jgi:hypothetical protein
MLQLPGWLEDAGVGGWGAGVVVETDFKRPEKEEETK